MNIKSLQRLCHKIAVEKGFWSVGIYSYSGKKPRLIKEIPIDRNNAEMIALMHSELSEALEELRKEDCDWQKVSFELADCIIRILDFCEGRKLNLDTAIKEKIKKNKKRMYKHGKKF